MKGDVSRAGKLTTSYKVLLQCEWYALVSTVNLSCQIEDFVEEAHPCQLQAACGTSIIRAGRVHGMIHQASYTRYLVI